MARYLVVGLFGLLLLTPPGAGSPLEGSWTNAESVKPAGTWKIRKTFRGGERAAVLVIGDHGDSANLEVTVYDAKGKKIIEDKGQSNLVGDVIGVTWFPPRDGEYLIEVRNPGVSVNKCYIAIK